MFHISASRNVHIFAANQKMHTDTFLLTYWLTNLFTYLLTYLITYLLVFLLIYLLNQLHTYLLIYSLTNLLYWEKSFRKAKRFSGRKEITRILWKPKVHYSIHKCPPSILILNQLDPSIPPKTTSWRSILMLSSCLHLVLQKTQTDKIYVLS